MHHFQYFLLNSSTVKFSSVDFSLIQRYLQIINPSPPPVVFCPLLKKSLGNPYLKILDFSQLLVANTPMNFFMGRENRSWPRGLRNKYRCFDDARSKALFFPLILRR